MEIRGTGRVEMRVSCLKLVMLRVTYMSELAHLTYYCADCDCQEIEGETTAPVVGGLCFDSHISEA